MLNCRSAIMYAIHSHTNEDLLYGKASRDARFLNAFVQRNSKPEEWNKVLKGYANKIKSDFGKPIDKQVTDDREAVVNSIRGKSTTVEDETPNFSGWSDNRFEHWKRTGKDNPNL